MAFGEPTVTKRHGGCCDRAGVDSPPLAPSVRSSRGQGPPADVRSAQSLAAPASRRLGRAGLEALPLRARKFLSFSHRENAKMPFRKRFLTYVRQCLTAVRHNRTDLSDLFGGTSRSLADRSRWSGWVLRCVMYPFFLYWSGAMPPTNF